ncbi:MAG TPA: GNAT family N-acetyltransferase [Verrucomicrobiae bacterium]|nr:GNAT family N-acetyltransferase [Verrucomicrobiae bacterium]
MFSVRVAKVADAKKIALIHVDAWRLTYRGQVLDDGQDPQSIEQRESFWRQRLMQGNGWVFIVESDDVVGFCHLVPSRDKDADSKVINEIAAHYVVSDHSRLGAGKALSYHVLARVQKQGIQALTVWIPASNRNAMGFYESLGFARDGAVKIGSAPDGSNLHVIRYRIKFNRAGQAAEAPTS